MVELLITYAIFKLLCCHLNAFFCYSSISHDIIYVGKTQATFLTVHFQGILEVGGLKKMWDINEKNGRINFWK